MKQKQRFGRIVNKRARHDYEVLEEYEAGIVLTGAEVKSVRMGRVQLSDSYAVVHEGEVYIVNMHISEYAFARPEEYDPKRSRKLLLHRQEIDRLSGKLQQKGLSLVPLVIFESHNRFKVELGLVRGKKEYQKREQKKRADIKREVEREIRGKYKD